jgi:hypothetical protein
MKSKLILLALAITLVGCELPINEERKTAILEQQLKREKMKLEHLQELHRYRNLMEFECRAQDVDSLILRFNQYYELTDPYLGESYRAE